MLSFFKKKNHPPVTQTDRADQAEALQAFINDEASKGLAVKTAEREAALASFLEGTTPLEEPKDTLLTVQKREGMERNVGTLKAKLKSLTEAATHFEAKKTTDSAQDKIDIKIYTEFFSRTGVLGSILSDIELAHNLTLFTSSSETESRKNIDASEKYLQSAQKKYNSLRKNKLVLGFVGRHASRQ